MNKQRLMLLDPSQFTDVQGHLILSASAIFNIHCCSANSSNRIESRGVSKMGEDILGIGHWFRSEFQVHGTQPESASQKREDVIGIGRCFKSDFMCIVMFEAGRKFSNRRERYLLLILARPILESNRKVPRNRCDSRPWLGGNNRNRSMPSKNFHGLVYYPTPWSGPRPRISMLMIAV